MILEALKGLSAISEIAKQLERIGDKLDDKQALERLADKRKRNRDAVDGVLVAASGRGSGVDSSPAVSGGSDSSAGLDTVGTGPDSGARSTD